ncbi:MAG: hypothetical protein EOO29_16980 [Comamonadaceae bacterium]|nr:MAG: hypothetical protein EOO29_16980 [Comamonadaceae bacterium]
MFKLRTLAIAALSAAAAFAHAQEINFGIIATDSASTQRERWEPFFKDMEKKTGLSVKSFYAPDYAGVIEAMRFNKILFSQNKIDYRTAFKTARSASHGANIQAVLARQIDVATNNTEELDKLKANKPELASQLRVLWESPLIPSDPFVMRKDLDPAVKAKIKTFVLNYAKTDEQEKTILKNIYNYGGFRESSNEQLVPIRQLELFKDRSKVENDTALDAATRAKQLAEIDAKLAALKL